MIGHLKKNNFFYDLGQKRKIWHRAKIFEIVVVKGRLFEQWFYNCRFVSLWENVRG